MIEVRLNLKELDNRWLALQVRAGWEIRCAYLLRERGYTEFLPLYQQKRKWSDREKIIPVPLFTGYLFLFFEANNRESITSVPGFIRFVGTGNTPVPIDDGEINALQIATTASVGHGPCAFLEVGQEVEVRNGPLAGLTGKIVRFKNKLRLVLSVAMLQKSMFVEIDGYEVAAVARPVSPQFEAVRMAAASNIISAEKIEHGWAHVSGGRVEP
ncbi:MAG TPA: transcription termination/antitermination NusG family protein [Candidatus Angelobacter sp.]